MIDHVLGRPSVTFRKYQVFAVVAFWSLYLAKGNSHGPPFGRRVSLFLSKRLTAWQSVVITLLWLYVARNFGKIMGLECPEPLANLYSRSYFRATYVTTALDAGFWSAMHVKRKWARDLLSIVCSVYYMICAEQADEKVRKIRSVLTVDHLRVSWNKTTSPYLSFLTKLTRPRFMRYQPRAIRIPRPSESDYTEPVRGWLYFDGPVSALKKHNRVVLAIPGGGFVAMSPRTHDDALLAWAGKTGLPVLALDYKKAPEFPYPYALNECFDVYRMLITSRGRCVGLSGESVPQIVLAGDSAGGNLAAGVTLMVLQSSATDTRRWYGEDSLPSPAGLVLIYPALDVNIGNWMTDDQMALISDRRMRNTNKRVLRHKSDDFRKLSPGTPLPTDNEDSDTSNSPDPEKRASKGKQLVKPSSETNQPEPLKTRLATPSLISYVSDRVLTPEMMRAMIILYIGPHNRPDFSTEYLLSPVLAPDSLLAKFPKTYFLTGERDPLVDDTLIMAGRIRAAKAATWRDRQELGVLGRREERKGFDAKEHVEVKLIEGISHGFIQFAAVFPEAWNYIFRVGGWFEACFEAEDRRLARERADQHARMTRGNKLIAGVGAGASSSSDTKQARDFTHANGRKHHRRTPTGASSGDDDSPLEMSSLRSHRAPTPAGHKANGSNGTWRANKPHGLHIPATNPALDNANDAVEAGNDDYESSRPTTPYTPAGGLVRDHPLGRDRRRGSGQLGKSGGGAPNNKSVFGGTRRNKSLVSLGSEDDLLGRRMNGLVGGLTRAYPDVT